jgi:hypothetical protein
MGENAKIEKVETIFSKIDKLHEEKIQMSGKTNAESETKKEEGWN